MKVALLICFLLSGVIMGCRPKDPECSVVLDRKIKRSELEPHIGQGNSPQERQADAAKRLLKIVILELTNQFVTEKHLEVSDTEISAVYEARRKMRSGHELEFEEQRRYLERQRDIATGEEKQRWIDKLAALDIERTDEFLIENICQQVAAERGNPDGAIRAALLCWKINKSLYERYGGRVLAQNRFPFPVENLPEPIDAYYKFLKEQETAGTFVILDDKLRMWFWHHLTNDTHLGVIPEKDVTGVMNTPPFLSSHLSAEETALTTGK